MKVLLLITKGEIGGAQIFVANLAKGLKNYQTPRIIPTVSCGEGSFLFDFCQKENIDFHKFQNLKRSSGFFSNIIFFVSFYKFLRKNSFDIIHLNSSNTLFGAISAKLSNRKTRVVFTVHGLSILDPNYQASFIKKLIFNIFFKICLVFVDEIVFVSKNNLDLFLAKNKKLTSKCSLIYNGIEVDFLSRLEARSFIFDKIGLSDEGQFLAGSIGRLAYPKNYEFLIDSFPDILKIKPKAKLVLLGDGPERSRYEALIKQKGLIGEVFLLGEIKDASKYLKALDLFVLPSIYEGLSISLIEVLFSGIKVMASRVGGNEEVIGRSNCYELNDKVDFIDIFKKIISSEQKSCTDINKFLTISMIDKYISIYEKK